MATTLWGSYQRRKGIRETVLRTLPGAFALFALIFIVQYMQYSWPTPVRGPVARSIDAITSVVAWTSAILLTLYVIDATRLFHRFVELLSVSKSDWGKDARKAQLLKNRKVPREIENELVDIHVIANHSEAVGHLVIGPFVLLVVLGLSHSVIFDRWHWTPTLMFGMGALLFATLVPAVMLRLTSEQARKRCLSRVREYECQVIATASEDSEAAEWRLKQIEMVREEIETIDRGSFSPYSRSPILKAVLIPFGGIGIFALLELLVLFEI